MPLTICDNMVPFIHVSIPQGVQEKKRFKQATKIASKRGHGHYRNSIIDIAKMWLFFAIKHVLTSPTVQLRQLAAAQGLGIQKFR